jgi:hypothetical protein
MEKSKKKKRRGRPPGRKAPNRPVVGARVPEALYEELTQAAQASGRTISEELVWRTNQSLQWNEILSDLDRAMRFIYSTEAENKQQEEMDKTIQDAIQLVDRVYKWLDDFFFAAMVKVGLTPIKQPLTSERVVTAISRAEFPSLVEDGLKRLKAEKAKKEGPPFKSFSFSLKTREVSIEPSQEITPELHEFIVGLVKHALVEAKAAGVIREVPATGVKAPLLTEEEKS